jgi:hypothetical protein
MAAKIIDRIETFRGLDKSHYFRLVAANNEIVSISEAYTKPSSRNETAEQLATQLRVAIVSGSTRFKPAKPALPTPAEQTRKEMEWKTRREENNRLFPPESILLLIPAGILALGVDRVTRYFEDYRFAWLTIMCLFYLAAAEHLRSKRMQKLLADEFAEKEHEINQNAYRLAKSDFDRETEGLKRDLVCLRTIKDELRPSWQSIRAWFGHIGYMKDRHGVPIVVDVPSAIILAKSGESEPQMYYANQNGGYIDGHQFSVEGGKVRLVKNPSHRSEDFTLTDTPMTHEGWVFASANIIDFGAVLRLLDTVRATKVSAQKS